MGEGEEWEEELIYDDLSVAQFTNIPKHFLPSKLPQPSIVSSKLPKAGFGDHLVVSYLQFTNR